MSRWRGGITGCSWLSVVWWWEWVVNLLLASLGLWVHVSRSTLGRGGVTGFGKGSAEVLHLIVQFGVVFE